MSGACRCASRSFRTRMTVVRNSSVLAAVLVNRVLVSLVNLVLVNLVDLLLMRMLLLLLLLLDFSLLLIGVQGSYTCRAIVQTY
ncbi:hypothetical protein BCR37DRAFT_383991 [Protomyces lactucae-debilis]|uniref:Uncharacterized protein n=1 Tax=Protomyces lactucae-debilis TaxID=2754530 RepID=A0A1Y2EW40_PROLT|nr:uncharacterized protein BCR37DRAFT_383991 [Protomyces lactucae-debilis]ORY75821.1 hypothetical protein BCR37DRAFT_383991 [Protomyces lactucae-debilis]